MKSSVSIVRCQSYDGEEVLKGLRQAVNLLGGIEKFVRRGDRVLLKPNLLYGKAPEKAVTTHPSIIKGVIQIVREGGGVPFIGDSSIFGSLVRVGEKAGIKGVADEMNCPMVGFDRPVLTSRGEGRFFKQLEIDQAVLEADVVINLPKWKTHGMMLLTLGAKNLFGCIPGQRKALWHLRVGKNRKLFAQMLVDLHKIIKPSVTILDGIVGMEGSGPGSGRPIPLGLILASRNPFSLDQIVCDLLRIPRESLLTNRVALEQGLAGDGIEVFGERVEEVRIHHFRLPTPSEPDWNLPGFIRKILKNGLTSRPVVESEKCQFCDRCVEICPNKALEKKERGLIFDYGKCIRCFCCQEVCSEGAITLEPGWAVRFIGHIRKNERSI